MTHKKKQFADRFPEVTVNHQHYWEALTDKSIQYLFCTGPAGTTKTIRACKYMAMALRKRHYDKIVICTSITSVDGEELGHLKGDVSEKMSPHVSRVTQHLDKFLPKSLTSPSVEVVPLSYIRGRDIDKSIMIVDEAQNCGLELLIAILSRVSDNSKVIFCGDAAQSDKFPKDNVPLIKVMNSLEIMDCVECIRFDEDDILRSANLKRMLSILSKLR